MAKTFSFLAAVAAVLTFLVLARPLLPIDETRYLAVAWEMRLSGDMFHLTRNFESYAHKPPMLFWLINLVWALTGVSELAARLIGPACALATVAATGWLAGRLWPSEPRIVLRSMVVAASFSVFITYGSAVMFDALLAFLVLLGIGVIRRIGQVGATTREWGLLGIVLGLGVLAKGPVILVHLLPVLLAMRFWAVTPLSMREAGRGAGLAALVALGLVALWLVPALSTGDAAFRHELLWTQTAARVTGEMGHGRPYWFLLVLLPVVVFPWGWSWRVWSGTVRGFRSDGALRLCLIWIGGAVVIFSVVGGKQMHYLLPELPGLALIVARALGDGWNRRGGTLAPFGLGLLAALLVGVALGALAPIVGDDLVLSTADAWFLAGCLAVLAYLGLVLRSSLGHALMGLGLPVVLHLVIAFGGVGPIFETQPIADALAPRLQDGVALVGMPYNADFNFKARMTSPVALPAGEAALEDWMRDHPEGWVIGPVVRTRFLTPPLEQWVYRERAFGLWSVVQVGAAAGT